MNRQGKGPNRGGRAHHCVIRQGTVVSHKPTCNTWADMMTVSFQLPPCSARTSSSWCGRGLSSPCGTRLR